MKFYDQFSSSNVSRIGYEESNSTLEVHFHNGSIYQYYDVPLTVWEGIKNAGSKGSYLHQNIKGQYRYARV